jgi:hypothetical protein
MNLEPKEIVDAGLRVLRKGVKAEGSKRIYGKMGTEFIGRLLSLVQSGNSRVFLLIL